MVERNKITDIELQREYRTLLEEYTWVQDAMYNYSQYVQEHKDKTTTLLSPAELITRRTQVWERLRPIMLEMKERGLE
jgi:hypothetical protein